MTSFWTNNWIGNKPLSIQFPTLFSHIQHPNRTVVESFTENGWQLRFRHITFRRAERELDNLMDLIDGIILNDEADTRSLIKFSLSRHAIMP
jgi:hypothetical protein